MKCPACNHPESKVIDSRPTAEGASIRRRRECLQCQRRFTTYEIIEDVPMLVVKKDNTREAYDRNKLLAGIIRACDKRKISKDVMESIVSDIERNLQNSVHNEIPTSYIGEMVMRRLKEIDEVAYVRFASVYRQFKDLDAFVDELNKLLAEKK
ncbi:MAG: transcriptional regulator NrdR [Ruminococcaceae bacterium]|nr:transcriptional regulator NrdR [Oscillospiraceae bacterium]